MNEMISNMDSNGNYKPSTRVIVPGCQGGVSQIHFGDDLESEQTIGKSVAFKPSTRVLVPGCQGGVSQIKFGHDELMEQQENKQLVNDKVHRVQVAVPASHNASSLSYKPSTRVLQQPGGHSSITFG